MKTVFVLPSIWFVTYANAFQQTMPTNTEPSNSSSMEPQTTSDEKDWNVNLYQDNHSFVWEYGSSLVDILDPKRNERIIDLGCGSGELTQQIANRGAIAMGMDADPNMIQRAKQALASSKSVSSSLSSSSSPRSLSFYQADARTFEVPNDDGPVDAIFSNAALHWIRQKDANAAVQSIARALKPGGRLVIEMGGRGNIEKIERAILQTLNLSKEEDSPWHFPGISEYSTLLETNGIEVLSAALFDRPTTFKGPDGMVNWLLMFGNTFWEGMSKDEKQKAIQEISDMLQSDPKLFDGENWTGDYRRLRIVGRKIVE